MYVPAHFSVMDSDWPRRFVRANPFATVAGIVDTAVAIAYAPVVLDTDPEPFGRMRFHLARANPMAEIADGSELKLSFLGSHAYVSPDCYESRDQVPTWNYLAVEACGRVRRLNEIELRRLLSDLTRQEESALAPKAAWTMARLPQGRLETLLPAIIGFEVLLHALVGKSKLSQNRTAADRAGVIAGLEGRGDGESRAVATAMRAQEGN